MTKKKNSIYKIRSANGYDIIFRIRRLDTDI